MCRILLLRYLTGYRPSSDTLAYVQRWILFQLKKPFYYIILFFSLSKVRLSAYWSLWKENNRPLARDRETINYNLYRLSEKLDFAFSIHQQTLKWNRTFGKNPIPSITVKGKTFEGKKFVRDIAPFTNITAKEYCDCCELFAGYQRFEESEEKELCLNKLISILYPASSDYNRNLVSDHAQHVSELPAGVKFGILYWFASIVEFYTQHPVYAVLFKKESHGDDRKISVGMNEAILMIKSKGYPSIVTDTINDFYDTQIKIIKDNLSLAIAEGAKVEELAQRTGMSIDIINRLT